MNFTNLTQNSTLIHDELIKAIVITSLCFIGVAILVLIISYEKLTIKCCDESY